MSAPKSWDKVTIGDVVDRDIRQAAPESSVGYIDISSINRQSKTISELSVVDGPSAPTRARQWVRANDVLVSMTRPNLNAVAHVQADNTQAVASTGFCVLRANRAISPAFLFYRVQAIDFIEEMSGRVQGALYPAVRPADVLSFEFDLPPRTEQERIAAVVEEYLSELSASEGSLTAAAVRLGHFRASILNAAVTGRLVPTEAQIAREEGRDYEPADVLLARILRKRRQRWEEAELAKMTAAGRAPRDDWKKRYAEPIEPDTSPLPELPEGWCWATLDMLIQTPLSNGRSVTTADSGFPVLRLTAIGRSIDLHETKIGNWSREMAEPFLVRSGDFLIARGNGSLKLVGRGGLVPAIHEDVAFPDTMIRARLGDEIVREFVAIVWDSQFVRQQIETSAKTTAGIYKVNQRDLERIVLPIAPRSEQRRIVEAFDDSDAQAHVAAASVRINAERVAALRQSILHWAFEGKLVDQDPNDEPASELIARIRAERAARPPVQRTRRGAQPAEPRRTPGKRRQTPPR